MFRRPSPATLIACVALFFSLGAGGALAASHYLITNIHQIRPNVRRELRGRSGPRGRAGVPFDWSNVYTTQNTVTLSAAHSTGTITAICRNGHVLSGGIEQSSVTVSQSEPLHSTWGWRQTGWVASGSLASGATSGSLTVIAVCQPPN